MRGNRRAHFQRSLRKPVEVSTHAAADSRRLAPPKGPLNSSESMRSPAGIDGLPTDTSPESYLITRRSKNDGKFCEVAQCHSHQRSRQIAQACRRRAILGRRRKSHTSQEHNPIRSGVISISSVSRAPGIWSMLLDLYGLKSDVWT
jgi:hypothetical protein